MPELKLPRSPAGATAPVSARSEAAAAADEPSRRLDATYQAAFGRWLALRQAQSVLRQASSVAVYRSMWLAFSHWCVDRDLPLSSLDAVQIEAFVRSRAEAGALSDRHAWRWLTLLDAVLRLGGAPGQAEDQRSVEAEGSGAHGTAAQRPALQAAAPNRAAAELLAARPAWRYANASDLDPAPEHLDATQARRLVDWLMDETRAYSAPGAAAGSWQALRNRCAVALQLGAGLTPGDARAALVSGVVSQGGRRPGLPTRLRVPAHGAVAEREAPLAPWAARLLQQWLLARGAAGLPQEVLLPGTRQGKPWAKVAQYNAAQSVLAAAGIGLVGGGSFVLRHTFALRQLRRGHAPEDVARWLGVSDPGVMARYQRLVFQPTDLA